MDIRKGILLGVAAVTLAACGDTPMERALLGAGGGAVTSAVLDADLATGALIGAVGNVAFCDRYPERC